MSRKLDSFIYTLLRWVLVQIQILDCHTLHFNYVVGKLVEFLLSIHSLELFWRLLDGPTFVYMYIYVICVYIYVICVYVYKYECMYTYRTLDALIHINIGSFWQFPMLHCSTLEKPFPTHFVWPLFLHIFIYLSMNLCVWRCEIYYSAALLSFHFFSVFTSCDKRDYPPLFPCFFFLPVSLFLLCTYL